MTDTTGRWTLASDHGWVWVPDTVWAPSWVQWQVTANECGWAPLPPEAHYEVGIGFTYYGKHVSSDFHFGLSYVQYAFVPSHSVCEPNLTTVVVVHDESGEHHDYHEQENGHSDGDDHHGDDNHGDDNHGDDGRNDADEHQQNQDQGDTHNSVAASSGRRTERVKQIVAQRAGNSSGISQTAGSTTSSSARRANTAGSAASASVNNSSARAGLQAARLSRTAGTSDGRREIPAITQVAPAGMPAMPSLAANDIGSRVSGVVQRQRQETPVAVSSRQAASASSAAVEVSAWARSDAGQRSQGRGDINNWSTAARSIATVAVIQQRTNQRAVPATTGRQISNPQPVKQNAAPLRERGASVGSAGHSLQSGRNASANTAVRSAIKERRGQ